MPTRRCAFCQAEIDAVHEFDLQFEPMTSCDDDAALQRLRNSLAHHGAPLRLCNECKNSINENLKEIVDEERVTDAVTSRAKIVALAIIAIATIGIGVLFLCSLASSR